MGPIHPPSRWCSWAAQGLALGLAMLVGVVLFVLTGWVAALALGPIIVLLAPTLLGRPHQPIFR